MTDHKLDELIEMIDKNYREYQRDFVELRRQMDELWDQIEWAKNDIWVR